MTKYFIYFIQSKIYEMVDMTTIQKLIVVIKYMCYKWCANWFVMNRVTT